MSDLAIFLNFRILGTSSLVLQISIYDDQFVYLRDRKLTVDDVNNKVRSELRFL